MSAAAHIRRVLPFLSIILLALLVYDGWVFYSRWDAARQAERRRAEQEAEDAKRTLALIGGLKILDFYASPVVAKGGTEVRLCYSVVGAKTLRIAPAVKNVYPAFSHCVPVSPRADTEYSLVAEDESGHSVSKKVLVRVER